VGVARVGPQLDAGLVLLCGGGHVLNLELRSNTVNDQAPMSFCRRHGLLVRPFRPRPTTRRPAMPSCQPSITPSLWFDYDLEEAATFCAPVFPSSHIEGFNRCTDAGRGEPGSVLSGSFVLDGTRFIGINGGPQFPFSEAVSFTI